GRTRCGSGACCAEAEAAGRGADENREASTFVRIRHHRLSKAQGRDARRSTAASRPRRSRFGISAYFRKKCNERGRAGGNIPDPRKLTRRTATGAAAPLKRRASLRRN